MQRNVYLDKAEIPTGTTVMGIKVRYPLILFMWEGGVDHDSTLYRQHMVYVELTPEEFAQAQGNQIMIDDLAREFAPVVERKLDAVWYRWIDEEGT